MTFKLKFDEMKDNDPSNDKNQPLSNECIEMYPNAGNSRNLLFSWPSGDWEFLNYAYLIRAKFFTQENRIILTYADYTVTLKGEKLKELGEALMLNTPKKIRCVDSRYLMISEKFESIVTEIIVEERR